MVEEIFRGDIKCQKCSKLPEHAHFRQFLVGFGHFYVHFSMDDPFMANET